jgi:hypothetical protein
MKRESIEDISADFDDNGIEEIDLTEGAMYKRAFKKFYFQQKKGKPIMEDEENDCDDIDEEEIDELVTDIEDEDVEIEEEDLQ